MVSKDTTASAWSSDWLGAGINALVTPIAIAMSLYHVWVAYMGGYEPVYQRSLSLLFGLTLVFLVHSGTHLWSRLTSMALAGMAAGSLYYTVSESWRFARRLTYVEALPTMDLVVGTLLIALVLEGSRRSINNALPLIALTFLVYTLYGPYFPWQLAHKGATFVHMIELQFTTTDGLWSTPLNVFSVYIFLFILFGAFLERMGAADVYIRLSVALTGKRRGGPAKAAIFASGLTGSITGSANANIATTGPFTIPLMKRTGFKPEIAAGVETAASTGGQIMPPVMGASAFLIVEFTGIPYWEIVKVSLVPAALYFFSVYTMVHLEARKAGLVGLPRDQVPTVWSVLKDGGIFLIPPLLIFVMVMNRYRVPYAGLAGILSVIVLAGLKAAWGLAQKAHSEGLTVAEVAGATGRGLGNIVWAMDMGARRSLPICGAVATVGMIIGALFQSGLGLKMSSIVISLSQGNLFLGLVLVALSSFVLGMGLPTAAAYIVLSVMAVPALMELGADWGLTLLAAHLIVFWYSLDSCFTPPVCVPAYTAAGIANAHPTKSAWAAFRSAKGMYVIPVLFAYTPLLMVDDPLALAETAIAGLFGFLGFGALMVGHMYVRLTMLDRGLLIAATAALFWPMPMLHIPGLIVLGGVFVWQRARYAEAETSASHLKT